MTKKDKVNLISSCIVVAYFIGFLVLTCAGACIYCGKILWTLFLVPHLTHYFLGYDGQSDAVIWGAILVEMILLFFFVKLATSLFVKENSVS